MFVRFFLCWLCFGMFVGLFVSLDVFGSFFCLFAAIYVEITEERFRMKLAQVGFLLLL